MRFETGSHLTRQLPCRVRVDQVVLDDSQPVGKRIIGDTQFVKSLGLPLIRQSIRYCTSRSSSYVSLRRVSAILTLYKTNLPQTCQSPLVQSLTHCSRRFRIRQARMASALAVVDRRSASWRR